MAELLAIESLSVAFPVGDRWTPVLRGVSLEVGAGEVVGLVGESGSGKSMTALSILRLVPSPGRILEGRILFEGRDLLELEEEQLRRVRGGRIGMVFQEPMTALNPVFTIGFQIAEGVRVHRGLGKTDALEVARGLLERVAMPDPGERLSDYPHQLSGGQRQRAMIAMALAADPVLLIADEPTTALDVTIQAQILDLLLELRAELGLAVLLITHDLAVVAETCERVVVMYAGEVVEESPTAPLFAEPSHPYTQGLLRAMPRLGEPIADGRLATIPGQVPAIDRLPEGCPFHPRCSQVLDRCSEEVPELYRPAADRLSRCFLLDSRGAA